MPPDRRKGRDDPVNYALLVAKLGSPLPEIRNEARAQFAKGGEAALPSLIQALADQSREVRGAAALLLGELRATLALGRLEEMATGDPDPGVRSLAVRALSDLADRGSGKRLKLALAAQLGSEDMFCRALACRGLGRIGDAHCREALRIALKDKEEWVRNAAQQALVSAPVAQAPEGEGREGMAIAAAEAPAAALARQLRSLDIGEQRRAQGGLAALGAAAVPEIAPLLWDAVGAVRRAAAETLGAVGAPESLDPLARVLADERAAADLVPVVLHATAQILARCGPSARFPAERALALLDSSDQYVRAAACHALIRAGGAHRSKAFKAAVEDDEDWVRVVAYRAFAEAACPDDRALRDLVIETLAQAATPALQAALLEALRRILVDPEPGDQTVVAPVSFFLRSQDSDVRRSALELVVRVAQRMNDAILDDVMRALEEDAAVAASALGSLRWAANSQRAVSALARMMAGAHRDAARAAANALGTIGGAAAIEALISMANSQQGPGVAAAAQTLAALDPGAEITAARGPDGRWELKLQLRCDCGGELCWIARDDREELRCASCDREHLLSSAGKLFEAERTPLGHCLCCPRKQLLVRRGESQVLVCAISGEVHIRPFDHPRAVRLLRDLPVGACVCCAEPQPLVRIDERTVCYRTRRIHSPTSTGYVVADAVADDVAAINRALLEGTLGIGEHGIARGGIPPRRRS